MKIKRFRPFAFLIMFGFYNFAHAKTVECETLSLSQSPPYSRVLFDTEAATIRGCTTNTCDLYQSHEIFCGQTKVPEGFRLKAEYIDMDNPLRLMRNWIAFFENEKTGDTFVASRATLQINTNQTGRFTCIYEGAEFPNVMYALKDCR